MKQWVRHSPNSPFSVLRAVRPGWTVRRAKAWNAGGRSRLKASEHRGKSAEELREELIRLRREQFSLRMQRASEQLGQTHLITNVRRDIARVKTLLREQSNG